MLRYIKDHWRGRLSLQQAFWVNFLPLYGLLYLSERFVFPPYVTGETKVTVLVILFVIATRLLIYPWQVIGVVRASDRYISENTNRTWGNVALGIVLLSLIHMLTVSFTSIQKLVEYRQQLQPLERIEPLYSLSISENGKLLILEGPIQVGITRSVSNLLDISPGVGAVLLSSKGGQIYEGRGLARVIRERNLDTLVADVCSSACTTAFIAGEKRTLGSDARLGFHQYKSYVAFPKIDLSKEQKKDTLLFQAQNIDREFLFKVFAQPPEKMWWPSHGELLRARVVHEIRDLGHLLPDPEENN